MYRKDRPAETRAMIEESIIIKNFNNYDFYECETLEINNPLMISFMLKL